MGLFKKERLAEVEKKRETVTSHGILIVDDEDANLQTMRFLLQNHYEVHFAHDGQEALDLMRDPEFVPKVQLILCDQRMPNLTGVQFLQKIIDISPDIVRILVTGYTDIQSIIESINQAHIYKFMLKPVDQQDLLVTIRRALEAYDMRKEIEAHHRKLEAEIEKATRELREANQALRRTNQELEAAGEEIKRNHEKLLRTQGQLVMHEKMAFLGTLTTGIAHELKNPLNFIVNFSEHAADVANDIVESHGKALARVVAPGDEGDADAESALDMVKSLQTSTTRIALHGRRADEVLNTMLKLSRGTGSQKEPTDFNASIMKYVELAFQSAKHALGAVDVDIERDFDQSIPTVNLSATGIGRVVSNIIQNSVEALAQKRTRLGEAFQPVISVRTRLVGENAEMRFRDNGAGIPGSVVHQVFLPFFTTKGDNKHIGLGLSIAYDIVVQEHGGQIEVHASEGEHTEFVVRLPLV
jgi:signal transduction histidine kinase